MRLLTIDASVFVSAARPNEIGNAESTGFLKWVRNTWPRLFLPTLVVTEVVAALSRTGSKPGLAQQYAMAVAQLLNTVMIALDEALARQAAAFGAVPVPIPPSGIATRARCASSYVVNTGHADLGMRFIGVS